MMRALLLALALLGVAIAVRVSQRTSPEAPISSASVGLPRAEPRPALAWSFGRGAGQLGRGVTPDGHPVAPSSFVAEGAGLIVLDQENRRVVRSDGTSLPLPGARADDLARGADGSLAILDRLGDKSIAIVDAQGRLRGRLPLEGPGLEDARQVTRVVVSGAEVYVERNGGGPLLRVGATDGKPAAVRDEIPGIPTRDGTALVSAGITNEEEGRAWVTVADRQGAHRWTRELTFPGELTAVGFLDSGGGAVWAVLLAGATRAEYINHAVCLDVGTGRVRASVDLAVEAEGWQSFRDFAVRDDGSLVAATRGGEGVAFASYACPGID